MIGIERDHKEVEVARKGQSVCVKIEHPSDKKSKWLRVSMYEYVSFRVTVSSTSVYDRATDLTYLSLSFSITFFLFFFLSFFLSFFLRFSVWATL